MYWSGSKPFTSQANRTESCAGSNLRMGAAPGVPARSADQVDSTSFPTGVTSPRPVTTTRRVNLLSDLLVQVIHRIAHGAELLRVLVGDVDVELLLEGHDQLDGVQTVRAEVLHEARLAGQLLALHAKLLDDDVLDLLFDVAHVILDWRFRVTSDDQTAVHHQHLAGDVGGEIGGEEQGRTGHVLGPSQAPQGDAL